MKEFYVGFRHGDKIMPMEMFKSKSINSQDILPNATDYKPVCHTFFVR
jgi:hypothetical protein